jgi:hypothetical protein
VRVWGSGAAAVRRVVAVSAVAIDGLVGGGVLLLVACSASESPPPDSLKSASNTAPDASLACRHTTLTSATRPSIPAQDQDDTPRESRYGRADHRHYENNTSTTPELQ